MYEMSFTKEIKWASQPLKIWVSLTQFYKTGL